MIYELLGYAALIVLLMNFEPYHKMLQLLYLDMKPFTCTLCSGFWYSLPYTVSSYGLKGILYSASIGVAAELIDRKINTL